MLTWRQITLHRMRATSTLTLTLTYKYYQSIQYHLLQTDCINWPCYCFNLSKRHGSHDRRKQVKGLSQWLSSKDHWDGLSWWRRSKYSDDWTKDCEQVTLVECKSRFTPIALTPDKNAQSTKACILNSVTSIANRATRWPTIMLRHLFIILRSL